MTKEYCCGYTVITIHTDTDNVQDICLMLEGYEPEMVNFTEDYICIAYR